MAHAPTLRLVGAGARRGTVLEEEIEQLVFDGEVRFLSELLKSGELHQHFEEGEAGFDGGRGALVGREI